MNDTLIVKNLGIQQYETVWKSMREFTITRHADITDEVWLLQHYPVFTQGQAGKKEHLLQAGDIPIVQTDRGGQITYHGPGQLIAYTLVDLKRKKLTVRDLVCALENVIIKTLAEFDIQASGRRDAPGVYVNAAKIASIGLRIRRGCAYHGIAFNVAMNLTPYQQINPCGFAGLNMTQVKDFIPDINMRTIESIVLNHYMALLNYDLG